MSYRLFDFELWNPPPPAPPALWAEVLQFTLQTRGHEIKNSYV